MAPWPIEREGAEGLGLGFEHVAMARDLISPVSSKITRR